MKMMMAIIQRRRRTRTFWTRRTSPKAPFPITFSGSKSSAPSLARFSLGARFFIYLFYFYFYFLLFSLGARFGQRGHLLFLQVVTGCYWFFHLFNIAYIYTLLWFHRRYLRYSLYLYLYCICIYTLLWFHRRYLRYSVSLVACCRRRSIFASSVREGSDLGSDFVFFVFDVFVFFVF